MPRTFSSAVIFSVNSYSLFKLLSKAKEPPRWLGGSGKEISFGADYFALDSANDCSINAAAVGNVSRN